MAKQDETKARQQLISLITPTNANERKKFVTLFMIIVFSLLLVMSSYITNWILRLWFEVILFIAQLIIVYTILGDYYGG